MRIAFLVLLLALLPRLVVAANCYTAHDAYAVGDYATAIEQWRELAEKNNSHAQLMIGSVYFNGQGVDQDYAEAERWFRLAADNGNADAALQLSEMYSSGEGVTQDAAETQRWRERASELSQQSNIECHKSSSGGD